MNDIKIIIGRKCLNCNGFGNLPRIWGFTEEDVPKDVLHLSPKCIGCNGKGWIGMLPRFMDLKDVLQDAEFQAELKRASKPVSVET